jgi:ribonuclease-3
MSKDDCAWADLEAKLGYHFKDSCLLKQALTHRSHSSLHNECFEFLGDSLLNAVISHLLFNLYPDANEGELSRTRASLVCEDSLAQVARELDLGRFINMGSGEVRLGGRNRSSFLADTLEALLALIYIESGFEALYQVIQRLFIERAKQYDKYTFRKDAKTTLQEWLQAHRMPLPVYNVEETKGPEHAKEFFVSCSLSDSLQITKAWGNTRRCAEQKAAGDMLGQLGIFDFSSPQDHTHCSKETSDHTHCPKKTSDQKKNDPVHHE